MPRIFIYEFTTGGGLLAQDVDAALCDLATEGRAMVAALAADFAAIDGVEVEMLADRRLAMGCIAAGRKHVVGNHDEANAAFDRLAAVADWTIVIAPETGGRLASYCRRVVQLGGWLLGPPPKLVALASDKHATGRHLATAGVPAPRGMAWPLGPPWPEHFSFPAIWKPYDGAGSQGLRFVAASGSCGAASVVRPWPMGETRLRHAPREGRLEQFRPGLPVSVAALCGPNGSTLLPTCRQLLTDDGRFRYLGGALLTEPELAERATKLAARAVASLPQPLGYLGLDMVLGHDAGGEADFVIEINPRLTTSYVGLRAACEVNLAEAMLAIAQGRAFTVPFRIGPLRFTADGKIQRGKPNEHGLT